MAPKSPFEGPRGTWRARRVQIWSQLAPIGLTGLESWLPDTLTWYLASSGPPGPPKGPVLAPKGPFEGPRGTWRARRVQIWSQLLLIGLTGLESWLPDTLTWYLASSGPPGPPKGPVLAPKGPFEGPRGTWRALRVQIWSGLTLIGLTGLESWFRKNVQNDWSVKYKN